jgi:DNA-binding transcriptional ArsR family regulator/uncharacterized protein YndB with AHSA1/START domain
MTTDSVWRAVSEPTRRRLIELLRDGPRTTGDLCRAFSTTRFAVMKHLAVLERCGVIKVRRSGRERWNALDPGPLRGLEARWQAAQGEVPIGQADSAAVQPAAAAQAGFSHVLRVFIDAPAWRVFDALTVNVASWWGAPHLLAADASNLVIEPQPGGRFYEEWGHRQGALRGIVAAIRQDERLELTGTIFGGAPSALEFALEHREGGTLVTASLTSAAEPGGSRAAAAVLEDLVRTRLKSFVEQGLRSGVQS